MSLSPEERAQKIIEKECEEKTGVLNLNNLGLTEMPEAIAEMDWLRVLNFSNTNYWEGEKGSWNNSAEKSRKLNNALTVLPSWIKQFKQLEVLDCDDSEIKDINPISQLKNLTKLFFDSIELKSLKLLSKLSSLKILTINTSQVSDLTPLSGLTQLTKLYCSNNLRE